jgi:hypothetical protein
VCKVTSSETPPLCIFDFPSTDFSRSWEFGGECVEEGENRKGREEKKREETVPIQSPS